MIIEGKIVDLKKREIYSGRITVQDKRIINIERIAVAPDRIIMPGFVDSHIHIESSMLTPYEFSRIALTYGTVATVSDPHEIANVLGIEGVNYMIKSAEKSPLKFYFGAPSCVPASSFDNSGATLNSDKITELINRDDIYFLGEMMNFPGVVNSDEEVHRKIQATLKANKVVDGHAPTLSGEDLTKYVAAGISTDHEAATLEEGIEKIENGMKIQIREGSAAKDYEALKKLIELYPQSTMLCSDDLHPTNLEEGHINLLVKRALNDGFDFFDVLDAAITNPIKHYKLDVGTLQIGDCADFIVVDNLKNFEILETYIDGELVADKNGTKLNYIKADIINNFSTNLVSEKDIKSNFSKNTSLKIINIRDGDLFTKLSSYLTTCDNFENSEEDDILKIVSKSRYKDSEHAVGYISGFGLKNCAIASSVSHDSHNIIAVGTDDKYIVEAINLIIQNRGGLVYVDADNKDILPLPIAGIISDLPHDEVAKIYEELEAKIISNKIKSPFMTLAFMSLIVIPEIKINSSGLFDVKTFQFVDLVN